MAGGGALATPQRVCFLVFGLLPLEVDVGMFWFILHPSYFILYLITLIRSKLGVNGTGRFQVWGQ